MTIHGWCDEHDRPALRCCGAVVMDPSPEGWCDEHDRAALLCETAEDRVAAR